MNPSMAQFQRVEIGHTIAISHPHIRRRNQSSADLCCLSDNGRNTLGRQPSLNGFPDPLTKLPRSKSHALGSISIPWVFGEWQKDAHSRL